MRSLLLGMTVIGAAFAMQSTTAEARDFPFCLITKDTAAHGDCSYMTFEQCKASASGLVASCDRNYFPGAYDYSPPVVVRPYHRQRRYY